MRPPNQARTPSRSQLSSSARKAGSETRSIPKTISATVIRLRKQATGGTCAAHAATARSQRAPFRSSEMTLVSRSHPRASAGVAGSELDGITYRRPFPPGLTVEVLQARKRASAEQCGQGRRGRRRREASVILRRKYYHGIPSANGHPLRTSLARKPNELAEPRLGFLQAPSVSGAGTARRAGLRWRRGTTGGHTHLHLTRLVRSKANGGARQVLPR